MSPLSKKNENMTKLLDSLLDGYNKYLRPPPPQRNGGPPNAPIPVDINILIRSMGPISEQKMLFSMDCYFRQEWRDPRLAFEPPSEFENITVLRPSIRMMEKIWKPDTFVLNGRDSYLHKITFMNKFFRISRNGNVYYSQRLTIKSSCPMDLHKYPLDSQTCTIWIGSYGYSSDDLILSWLNVEGKDAVQHTDIKLAQFRLADVSYNYTTSGREHGNRSVLNVDIVLEREIGFYLLQIYLPCYLIVIISWVSFWINQEAVQPRIALGITTLLTTCTIAITGREGIPKVSYSTALDVFLLMCFSFVFATVIEYAGVHYFTAEMQKEGGPPADADNEETNPTSPIGPGKFSALPSPELAPDTVSLIGDEIDSIAHDSCWKMLYYCLKGSAKYKTLIKNKSGKIHTSKIDSLARITFPFCFIVMNILYWAGYNYYL